MKLSIQIEFDKVLELETSKNSVVVGRSPQSDLVVKHESISRSHCKIEKEKGRFYITDLGSSNGVSIDGKRLKPQQKTPFMPGVSQLALGTLECEVTDGPSKESEDTQPQKIIAASTAPSGEYTSTIRLARLDIKRELNKVPNRTPKLELEKGKPKAQRPKNPISGSPLKEEPKGSKLPSLRFVIMLIVLLGAISLILDHLGLL